MSFFLVPSFPLLCEGGGGALAAGSEYGLHSIHTLFSLFRRLGNVVRRICKDS